jgi:hypothetical protein
MASKPLACPYCRTWFEGSGRSVRCPACGKRFNADNATLSSSAARSVPERAAPASYAPAEPRGQTAGYELNDDDTDNRRTDDQSLDHTGDFRPEWGDSRHPEEERPEQPAEAASGRPNLSSLFTIATLLLLFVGPRFIDPGFILPALLALIAARWIYGRWAKGQTEA